MPRIGTVLVVGHLVAAYGCTLVQLQQESGQMTTRIADKEANLTQLESQRMAVVAERERLLSEIDNKNMTLNQLHSGLWRLRQENSRLRPDSEQQQREKSQFARLARSGRD